MSTSAEIPEFPVFPMLVGKVALITGGAQGMGKATASTFLRAGAKVVICDINAALGTSTAETLSSLGEICFKQCDISKSTSVQDLISFTVGKFGRLDVAVNNAALGTDKTSLTEMDEEYWSSVIDVNVTGTALCTKYELQQMKRQGGGGSIVIVASVNSFIPVVKMPAYTTSKHALLGLARHAAMEGGEFGVRVNAVAPGGVATDFAIEGLKNMNTTEDEFGKRTTFTGRFGRDHEVAQGSLWLASEASSYVTGIVLPIDGGYLIKK
ncbi:hypothetical protein F5Y18DRAFT_420083 [Xylariaceae sp. FL1019]|nr:hypothetical protein F5Y18DRAFT_420083 [Xylariaceae sp. FL1019]